MNDWVRCLRSPNNVRRYFNGGGPPLEGLKLLRVVFGPCNMRLAVGFQGIPPGATEKWQIAGYTAIDLIIRLNQPMVEFLEPSSLLTRQSNVSIELQKGRLAVSGSGGLILAASAEDIDAQFVPDPVMRRALEFRDCDGSDIEPGPIG